MYKFSFKIKHRGCSETGLSIKFPQHHITVVDIQSTHPKEKQYFYYITGKEHDFDNIVKYLKKSKTYKLVKEVERSKDTLLLLVVLYQSGYIQNIIQKHHGFFIDLHTIYNGYEYWHVGLIERETISKLQKEIKKVGEMKTLYIGEIEFAQTLLSKQQKKIFQYAYQQGYYEIPRKTTIAKISKALKLNPSTVGEHLLKAENKMIHSMAKKI
tara:strand:+ start:127 stop:762 length:636 start_codon:yes stop_codon:yes gene_type:complete